LKINFRTGSITRLTAAAANVYTEGFFGTFRQPYLWVPRGRDDHLGEICQTSRIEAKADGDLPLSPQQVSSRWSRKASNSRGSVLTCKL